MLTNILRHQTYQLLKRCRPRCISELNSSQDLDLRTRSCLPVQNIGQHQPILSGFKDSETYRSIICVNFSSSAVSQKKMGDRHSQEVPGLSDTMGQERPGKITKTDAEWKAELTPEQYSVCRNHGTERAWTGVLLDNKKKGVYICACCGVELFSSSSKFDSGSGWPSFYDVLKDKDVSKLPAVDIRQDISHGMTRTEVMCGKCGSHLGHVFNDGPNPTGLRYCINSVSLGFKSEGGASGNKNNL